MNANIGQARFLDEEITNGTEKTVFDGDSSKLKIRAKHQNMPNRQAKVLEYGL